MTDPLYLAQIQRHMNRIAELETELADKDKCMDMVNKEGAKYINDLKEENQRLEKQVKEQFNAGLERAAKVSAKKFDNRYHGYYLDAATQITEAILKEKT